MKPAKALYEVDGRLVRPTGSVVADADDDPANDDDEGFDRPEARWHYFYDQRVFPGTQFPEGVAVVIGGSGGIGSEICLRLAEHGADVALTYRSNRAAADSAAERKKPRLMARIPGSLSLRGATVRMPMTATTTPIPITISGKSTPRADVP